MNFSGKATPIKNCRQAYGLGLVILSTFGLAVTPAQAQATIDFSSVPSGTHTASSLAVGNVTFTSAQGGLGVNSYWGNYFANIPGAYTGNALNDYVDMTSVSVAFTSPVSNASILLSTTPMTTWTLTAYDAASSVLGTTTVTMPGTSQAVKAQLPFNGISYFDISKTTGNGNLTLFDDLTYSPSAVPTPEPSSVAAFAFTGLGAAGLILRARKCKANA